MPAAWELKMEIPDKTSHSSAARRLDRYGPLLTGMFIKKNSALVLALFAGLAMSGCTASVASSHKTDSYLYEDTRRLVDFVEGAAALIEQRGTAAFSEFGRADSRWQSFSTYLFVYDNTGMCVWHGMNPELVGRNLLGLHDALGKPVIQSMVAITKRPERDASGWVFYLWEERTDLLPAWKSSYVRKAVAPDGKTYFVGSGSSRMKVEKVFVRDRVEEAARLVQEQGRDAAFRELKDTASPYYFLGNFIFVLDQRGHSLVDPAYPTLAGGRDMSRVRDALGRPVIQEALQKLEHSDEAWVQFLWPKPGERLPSRKLMYVRKVRVDGEVLLVGSDFYLATPIWMKS